MACHFAAEIEAGTVKQTLATGIEAVVATEAVAAEAVEVSEGGAPEGSAQVPGQADAPVAVPAKDGAAGSDRHDCPVLTELFTPSVQHALDLVGIFVFAISGALLAVRKNFDVFGIAVLAEVTALGGGLFRDVMIGAIPPAAFTISATSSPRSSPPYWSSSSTRTWSASRPASTSSTRRGSACSA